MQQGDLEEKEAEFLLNVTPFWIFKGISSCKTDMNMYSKSSECG